MTTGCDHEHNAAVVIAEQQEPPRPIVQEVQCRFLLDIHQALEAAAVAHRFPIAREAFG